VCSISKKDYFQGSRGERSIQSFGHASTQRSHKIQDLLSILLSTLIEALTSTSIGQFLLQRPQLLQLSEFIGVILKIENFEIKPDTVMKGQNVRQ
jgi:hypothetical protein